jgi:hypothetical protein
MRWKLLIAMLGFGLVSWGAMKLSAAPAVTQPIAFPHKTHVEMNLQCTSCHERAERDAVAGRPPTALCLTCHAAGGSAELQKVQAFEKGGEIPWRRVWRLPPHVFFSHRVHVAGGKVRCQTCHGPMETLVRPPSRPLKTLRMSDCIGCHEKQARVEKAAVAGGEGAARSLLTDCNTCHH